MALPFTSLYIDGEWRPASGGATFNVFRPSSEDIVSTAAAATAADCTAAVEAAARAFPAWERTPLSVRRDVFLRAADIVASDKYRAEAIAACMEEVGATAELTGAMHDNQTNAMRHYAGMVNLMKGETFPSLVPGGQVFCHRRAFGVVLGIAPWNAPFNLTVRALGPPIMCGNTLVIKSSEECPRSQALVIKIFEEAGLPKGVLNFVTISKEDSPARVADIIAHPEVRKVNFTGGERVGRIIASLAGRHLKQCVLELGGKAAVVVLADADIPRAARAITSSALMNSGQVCMSTERVIVQRGAEDALTKELIVAFKQVKIGDLHTDPTAILGSMLANTSAENVIKMMQDAVAGGAEVVAGDIHRREGIVQPHILRGVKPGMSLWDKESFGPVISLSVVDTVEEAVKLANTSEYSLTAALWTRDVYLAHEISSQIRAHCVCVNGPTVHAELHQTMGGLGGMSGYGHFNIDDWTQSRMTVLHPAEESPYPVIGSIPELSMRP